jgi:uncharacterized protein YbjQ (UPF0145 family)
LSGNEIYCMRLKGLIPSGVVIGNSIQSMGFLGGVRSAFRGIVGGEIPDVTQMIHEGRAAAYKRMRAEADREQVHGVVGVTSELRSLGGNSEFLFVGPGMRKSCTATSIAATNLGNSYSATSPIRSAPSAALPAP